MWKAVQAEKETGGKQAEDFYIKSSVITDKRQKNRFLKSGIIYRNEKIRDYMNKEHFLKMLTRIAHSVAWLLKCSPYLTARGLRNGL